MSKHEIDLASQGAPIWRAVLAASSAGLAAIGLARFAYAPLIPAIIAANWFTPAETVYFGAANLAGYLAGAIVTRALARRIAAPTLLRATLVLVTLSFFASAWPFDWTWFFVWRFISGVSGAIVMIVAAPNVLTHVPPARRGLFGGIIFAGVGLGVAISGTLVPVMLRWGVAETWCGLGVASAILTVVAWNGFPRSVTPPVAAAVPGTATRVGFVQSWGGIVIVAMMIEYALLAFGLVPHMVFFVDYIARGLGWGIDTGGHYWVLFGIGAVLGPLVGGTLGDRVGFGPAYRWALLVEALAVGSVVATANPVALAVTVFLAGMLTAGFVPVAIGRIHASLHDVDKQRTVWAAFTICFALGQAGGGYFCSYLYAATGGYLWLYASGAIAALIAFGIDFGAARAAGRLSPR